VLDDDDLAAWIAGLDDLFALVADRFPRIEPRLQARAYVRGLLAPLAEKNSWTLAEAAGNKTPDRMQRRPRFPETRSSGRNRRAVFKMTGGLTLTDLHQPAVR